MTEQWTGDWMRDAETGQLIDGPAMTRYQMFMLIRELRAVIHAHAQTIRDKQAVIDAARDKVARLEAPVSDAEWEQFAYDVRIATPTNFVHARMMEFYQLNSLIASRVMNATIAALAEPQL